jgi:acetylglutamate kinase
MNIEYYNEKEKLTPKFYLDKAQVLLESLPYIKEYFNKIVIVKIGGSMMEDNDMLKKLLDDIILMKYVGIKTILVHGGGKQITKLMNERKIDVKFIDGLRVTTKEAMDVVKMVLIGDINSNIVSLLNRHGNVSMGISGNDANFIKCKKKYYEKDGKKIDLGYVGQIIDINVSFIMNILNSDYIPVIASIGSDNNGNIYNVNADTCAFELASVLKAKKMILLSDVDGIFANIKNEDRLISRLTIAGCRELIEKGYISSGMIPKINACIDAINNGVSSATILNGTKDHSVLIEIFTDRGIGTMITN